MSHKKKWYAVRVGRETGLYTNWKECKSQVQQYPGALFKSFATPKEALAWLEEEEKQTETKESQVPNVIEVYTDGGWNGKQAASAIWFGDNHPLNRVETPPGEYPTNQRAEIWAIKMALEATAGQAVLIWTDSLYAKNCTLGHWQVRSNQDIYDRVFSLKQGRSVEIQYCPAHSNIKGNESADAMCKQHMKQTLRSS
jgi:viroplasmin and RNaseH domain-containing protein